MKARTPIVVTFGGPHFMTVEPLPKHVETLHEERALLRLENANLRGKLSDARDALRSEVDRRTAPVQAGLVGADRRAGR